MFWRKKIKLPVTIEDQLWIEEKLTFLKDSIGLEKILKMTTISPETFLSNYEFKKNESDAYYILDYIKTTMNLGDVPIELKFFSDQPIHQKDGSILTTPADNFGRWKSAAGTYQKVNNKIIISIEKSQLKKTESLIATISHELAHQKLLGEKRITTNDEHLTDLVAIVYGFGIFIGNSKFVFQSGIDNGFGWKMTNQGYLPEQLIAYTMATLSLKKKEKDTRYVEQLNSSLRAYFKQSIAYLSQKERQKKSLLFWEITGVDFEESHQEKVTETTEAQIHSTVDEKIIPILSETDELIFACNKGEYDTVSKLLSTGISPNVTGTLGNTPLKAALFNKHIQIADLLITHGADIDYIEDPNSFLYTTALSMASTHDDLEIIYYLLKKGADVNFISLRTGTPLCHAIKNKKIKQVEILIDARASLELKSGIYIETPICYAARENQKDIVNLLVKNGAKIKPLRKIPRKEIPMGMVKFLKQKKYL